MCRLLLLEAQNACWRNLAPKRRKESERVRKVARLSQHGPRLPARFVIVKGEGRSQLRPGKYDAGNHHFMSVPEDAAPASVLPPASGRPKEKKRDKKNKEKRRERRFKRSWGGPLEIKRREKAAWRGLEQTRPKSDDSRRRPGNMVRGERKRTITAKEQRDGAGQHAKKKK